MEGLIGYSYPVLKISHWIDGQSREDLRMFYSQSALNRGRRMLCVKGKY